MERTISAMIGKGSVNHNTRAFTAKNVDKNRSADNVEFCQEDIKQVYHKLFDEARERYNAKQKRKDRLIDNYYEKIRRGKQEKLFHEVIFQIGNKDDMNAKNEDGLLAKRILTEFMDEFQARNPNLYVFSAHLHDAIDIQHIGSTAIPAIKAKPIIDIVVGVTDFEEIMSYNEQLQKEGIFYRGSDVERQLLYVMGDMEKDIRTHHIHVVKWNGTEWKKYIHFRDYLNDNENMALQYQKVKEELESKYADDRVAYTNGKQDMIDLILDNQ